MRQVNQSEPWLGWFVDSYEIPESGLGVCEVIGRGFYAVIWRDHYGPYATLDMAETILRSQRQQNADVLPTLNQTFNAGFLFGSLVCATVVFLLWLTHDLWESLL